MYHEVWNKKRERIKKKWHLVWQNYRYLIVVKLEKALESSQKKFMSLEQQNQQALQQKDQDLQDARLANQQMRQRIRELEQCERMCEMERNEQRLSQRLKCKICHVEEVQVLLSPCNHLVCCKNCVPNLPQEMCPICARIIQGTIMVFFAWVIFYFLNTITYICQRVLLAAATCLKFHFEYCK